MSYDDEAYLKACEQLRSAVYSLKENEIEDDDIMGMVEQALEDAE